MKRLLRIFPAFAFVFCNAFAGDRPVPGKVSHLYIAQYENVLGTSMEMKIAAGSRLESDRAGAAVLNEISRMSKILSGYDAKSEFSRWLQTYGQPVHVSRELFEVLDLFDQWRVRTEGAVDASAEVITRIWKAASAQGRIPRQDELSAAVNEVKRVHWTLDRQTQTATHLTQTPLVLNSFAKSYIIKHAGDVGLTAAGVDGIVLNIGGDLIISGKIDETVRISDPKADAENESPMGKFRVSNKAVATSGSYRRGELIGGRWYSHIVDPRTGQPADNIISATVVASDATVAGALATAFNVLSLAESQSLADRIPGVEYLIITREGRRVASPGWKMEDAGPGRKEGNSASAREGNGDFEMVVNLEINLQKEGFVKRPYVAVWVEDENHAPVRCLTVWHGSDKYLPELKSWYLKYRGLYSTDKNFNTSATSATRTAGKYAVKWDGKDDQGNFVKPGKYTVKIEAAREHGTYQLMRQEIDWNESPKLINLTGNIEIASASLDYRKKTNDK
jgi:thiamine biosynthesis lipoprotein